MHADSRKLEVKFNYEFLEDFQDGEEGETNIDSRYTKCIDEFASSVFSYCDALPPNSTKSWQPKKFTKHSHPLFLLVSSPVFLVLHSLLTQFGHFNFSEEAWLLTPHEAPTGNQSPELQVEEIWQIYLLWEFLHLSHFCDFSDSFWTCSLHSFR